MKSMPAAAGFLDGAAGDLSAVVALMLPSSFRDDIRFCLTCSACRLPCSLGWSFSSSAFAYVCVSLSVHELS